MTEEECNLLRAHGIQDKFHNQSILDYSIKDWFHTDEGNLFLSGEKDLLLFGDRTAKIIGILIQRWFVLAGGYGAVLTLDELYHDIIMEYDDEGFEDRLIKEKCIFVSNFQTEFDCHLEKSVIIDISNYIEKRHYDSRYSTILHASDEFHWYPKDFQYFINDCYITCPVDTIC